MFEVTPETLKNSYNPFDVVSIDTSVGFIREVSVNSGQANPDAQVQYAVTWLVGPETKTAWFKREELTVHGNIFVEIAKTSCHPMGGSSRAVESLFTNWGPTP